MLDLAPIEVHLEGRLGKKLLVILLALLSAVAILTGLCFFTYNTFIMPTTARGTCFILEPDQCSSLTTSRIEEESGITLPRGTMIVESGSSKNFKWGTFSALLQLPERMALRPDAGYERIGINTASRPGINQLREHGVDSITDAWRNEVDGTTTAEVVEGIDRNGNRWASIDMTWNG